MTKSEITANASSPLNRFKIGDLVISSNGSNKILLVNANQVTNVFGGVIIHPGIEDLSIGMGSNTYYAEAYVPFIGEIILSSK